jgi:hypothetical protein
MATKGNVSALPRRSLSLREFYTRQSISRSTALKEIERGRLKAKKVGKKLIITIEDEDNWLASLPSATGAA